MTSQMHDDDPNLKLNLEFKIKVSFFEKSAFKIQNNLKVVVLAPILYKKQASSQF
jgi:hypothetical protein